MSIRNYMEDVVRDVLEILLKERAGICKCQQCKKDMMAFALNRLPPKYIVSERGFTHSFIEEINNVDWKADVVTVVNLGIDLISKRKRKHHTPSQKANHPIFVEDLYKKEKDVYYYNFPHLIGQVFDKENFSPVDSVKVILFFSEKIAESSNKSWNNPYITNKATQGFYSFWPKAFKTKTENPEPKNFNFKLLFSKDNFYTHNKEFYIRVEPEEVEYKFIRRNFTEKIDLTILEKRKR